MVFGHTARQLAGFFQRFCVEIPQNLLIYFLACIIAVQWRYWSGDVKMKMKEM